VTDCDTVVVGGGILGLAVARELTRREPDHQVVVLEREPRLAPHQTSHNSGVVHAGIYYAPGSLKARLCVAGMKALYAFCAERGVAHERCGKLIVAVSKDELEGLRELERRGNANGVPGLRMLGAEELRDVEPHARGVAALHSPETGIVDFAAVAAAYAEDVRGAGGEVRLGAAVSAVEDEGPDVVVRLGAGPHAHRTVSAGSDRDRRSGELRARRAIVCAGAWSDRLALRAGAPADPRILPFRGGYLRLRPERRDLVRGLIYPVPDPSLPFLGVHLTRTIDGEVLVGPTALLVGARDAYRLRRIRPRDVLDTLAWPGAWRMAARWWRTGVAELRYAASRKAMAKAAAAYVPAIGPQDLLDGPAGIRAQAVGRNGSLVDDFVVSTTRRTLHIRNAPSPAATSSLALAELIADRAEELSPAR
jgi:(S)-2-hydroxyglutarate dehydrogenase